MTKLVDIAKGIEDSGYSEDITVDVSSVCDYAAAGGDDISEQDAERVIAALDAWRASDEQTSDVWFRLVVEPLSAVEVG